MADSAVTQQPASSEPGETAAPQGSVAAEGDEGNSPQSSPKRKPLSVSEQEKPGESAGTRHKKAERKPSLKSWLLNSLKRKGKRSGTVTSPSRGSVEVEASDFSFRQPPRVSPANQKRGSPASLDLHSGKAFKRRTQSSLAIETVRAAIAEDADGLPSELRGGTPLHYYVLADSPKKEKTDFLVSLLTTGEVEVDSASEDGNTPLHLAVKKGDLGAVKVLVAFGASVNATNNRGQTPLDIATVGYIQQERKLSLTNAALDRHLRRRSRDCSPKSSHAARSDSSQLSKDSPLLSKIVPTRPKFMDLHLDGDLEGWVSVDFTDGPPVMEKHVSAGREVRLHDLTDPVNIKMDDAQPQTTTTSSSSSSSANHGQVSTVGGKILSPTIKDDVKLRQAFDDILNLLHATGGMGRHKLQQSPVKPISLSGQHVLPDLSMELQRSIRLSEYEEGSTILNLYEALEDTINNKMEELTSLDNFDEALALSLQQQEMKRYNRTLLKNYADDAVDGGGRAGSSVLCLDGGGIRGLIQIEVLSQMERVTGRKIVHLFDWIIGTSTGALIALCLTYGEKSLEEVRHLYFKMKSEVFTGGSYGFNTAALERLLKETFPPHMTMDCPVAHSTKVLVAAVYKKTAPPQLHFFNNCFGDKFSQQPVWKVARYTTAAPMYFKECDDYVDGGVLANNPSESGLAAIQNFHHSRGTRLPIALVVSVGSGIYPAEEVGRIDVQDFLFFGRQWLSVHDTVKSRARNLIQLLTNALVESETVADNSKARCEGQGTPYYRFSPKLAEIVATGETDNGILINMIISTIVQTVPRMEGLHRQFVRITEANQKERFKRRRAL
jgi:hypothetical protein